MDCEDEGCPHYGVMRHSHVDAKPKQHGTYRYQFDNAEGKRIAMGMGTSVDFRGDANAVHYTLLFRGAQRRGVGVHINALVPKWKARIIALLGVK